MTRLHPGVTRRYVDGRFGQVHLHDTAQRPDPSAPALCCLHATAYSGQTFLPLFRRMASKRRMLAFDTPGYGSSDAPSERPSFTVYAEALAEAIGASETGGPVDLFGYHTGALLAVEIARVAPASVRRIVLCGVPFFEGDEKAAWRQTLVQPPPTGESFESFHSRWDYFVTDRTPGLPLDRAFACFVDELRAWPNEAWAHESLFDFDAAPALAEIRQPVLVVNLASALAPASRAAAARLEHATVVELPEVGGAPFDLGTEALASTIDAFLDA